MAAASLCGAKAAPDTACEPEGLHSPELAVWNQRVAPTFVRLGAVFDSARLRAITVVIDGKLVNPLLHEPPNAPFAIREGARRAADNSLKVTHFPGSLGIPPSHHRPTPGRHLFRAITIPGLRAIRPVPPPEARSFPCGNITFKKMLANVIDIFPGAAARQAGRRRCAWPAGARRNG